MPEQSDRSTPPLYRRASAVVIALFAIGFVLFALLAALSRFSVWGTLAASASLHVALAAGAGALVAAALRQTVAAACMVTASFLLALPTIQLYFDAPPAAGEQQQELTIVSANVLGRNARMAEAMQTVAALNADVLAVVEVTPEVERHLEALREQYPFQVVAPQTDNFGIALLSRFPIQHDIIWTPEQTTVVALAADVIVNERALHIYVAHSFPPVGNEAWTQRNLYLDEIAEGASVHPRVVVVGDFNATEADAAFQRMLEEGQLRDTRRGRGRMATWPAPLGSLGITLDHILVGRVVAASERRTGPIPGSDHQWVSARLAF